MTRGQPPGDKHALWAGDRVTYGGAHNRTRTMRGSARNQTCPCGESAAEWAYDGSDPEEKQSAMGPYSTDPARYIAMCIRCHRRHDLDRLYGANRCKRGHELTPENVYESGGRRECKTCKTALRRKAKVLPPNDSRHGTVTGYLNWRCRCAPCRAVGSEYQKARYRLKKATA